MSKYNPKSVNELRQLPYAQSPSSATKSSQAEGRLLDSLNTLQMKIDSLEKDIRDIKTMMLSNQVLHTQRPERLPTYGTQPAMASAPPSYGLPKYFNP